MCHRVLFTIFWLFTMSDTNPKNTLVLPICSNLQWFQVFAANTFPGVQKMGSWEETTEHIQTFQRGNEFTCWTHPAELTMHLIKSFPVADMKQNWSMPLPCPQPPGSSSDPAILAGLAACHRCAVPLILSAQSRFLLLWSTGSSKVFTYEHYSLRGISLKISMFYLLYCLRPV